VDPTIEHNWKKIKEIHSSTNPVARIQNQTMSKNITYNGKSKCMKKECDIDSVLNCCHEARVQLTGKKIRTRLGSIQWNTRNNQRNRI
jgi:hypothetical protein